STCELRPPRSPLWTVAIKPTTSQLDGTNSQAITVKGILIQAHRNTCKKPPYQLGSNSGLSERVRFKACHDGCRRFECRRGCAASLQVDSVSGKRSAALDKMFSA